MAAINFNALKRTIHVLSKNKYGSIRFGSVWTDDKIVKSPFQNIEVPNTTVHDYVWQKLDKWPQRTLSVCAVTGRGYTYEQAFKLSNAFAANLRKKLKIREGDAVAVMLPNIPDYPVVAMGIFAAGGVITSINPVYTAHEVQRQLLMSGAKLVVTLPELAGTIREALKLAQLDLKVIVVKSGDVPTPEGTVSFNELSEEVHIDTSCLKEVRRSSSDVCFMPYSSGTTGLPKGVELTHGNIVAQCIQINEPAIRCHRECTAEQQDAVLAVLPFFHIYGASVIMFHKMSLGIKMVTLAKFQPEAFLDALVKYRTNVLFAAPPIILLMASHPGASAKTYQYLDRVINGAAPLATSDAERFFDKAQRKLDFRQGYGLTETSPTVCISQVGIEDYATVGPPLPSTELKVVDGDLNSLGPNERGELWIRGPQVMRGYRDNPEANADTLTPDGWFRSGDLSVINEEGNVYIVDRLKELIKVKGFQVPPAELEGVIRDHPAVNDAAVIGVPHPVNGEAPKAFVVLNKGVNIDVKEICDFVNERVAPYKRIEDVVLLDSIPKSNAGKILRKDLKARYC